MNNFLKNTFILTIGAAIGSVVTYKLIVDKYASIAQEEIDSVTERFSKKLEEAKNTYNNDDIVTTPLKKPDLSIYTNILKNKEYMDYTDYTDPRERKEVDDISDPKARPYVISPDEFGEEDDHDLYVYTYYADGVVTDEGDEPIENEELDELIGLESLKTFGQYEDDSVFVRNEGMKIDYEILKDNSNYYDRKGPHEVD